MTEGSDTTPDGRGVAFERLPNVGAVGHGYDEPVPDGGPAGSAALSSGS